MDKFFCCHCIRMKEISISCEGKEDVNVAIGFALTLLVCSLFLAFNYPNRLVTNPMDHKQSWFPSVFRDSSRSRSFFKFIFPDSDSSSDEIYKLVIDNAGEMSDSKENGTRGILNNGSVPLTDNAGIVILDDCNFHEPVRLDNFDLDRTLTLVSPDGGFPVMNYRMTREFKPPFRVNALIEEAGSLKAEVMLKVRSDFSSTITANTVVLHMSLPKYTTRISFDLEPVRSYLLHYGYKDTLASFDTASRNTFPPVLPTPQENNSLEIVTYALDQRKILRQLIRNGDIDSAFKKLQEWYPELVQDDMSTICFLLHCQKYIELVTKGMLESAVTYARSELSRFFGVKYMEDLLQDCLALLAYEEPAKSSVGYLLSLAQRELVADAVNAVVLSTNPAVQNPECCLQSSLERLLRQLAACCLEKRLLNGGQGEIFLFAEDITRGQGRIMVNCNCTYFKLQASSDFTCIINVGSCIAHYLVNGGSSLFSI